jgi:hypothetical protein
MKTVDDISLTRAQDIAQELLSLCESVTAKRAKTVIDHILKNGIITNEDLSQQYGYDHPPRAIRDVRENGIPLITHKVTSKTTGRKIGAYTFDDLSKISKGRIGGRVAFSKQFKDVLLKKYGSKDAFTATELKSRYLQIDHRIPYEVAGNEADTNDLSEFMLIDASSQRAKSWSCENCKNLNEIRDKELCKTCFWAYPENYTHVALEQERRIALSWRGDEVKIFDNISKNAERQDMKIQNYIKEILKDVPSGE